MAVVGGGGQAEMTVVHERMLMPVPENLSWPEAGGMPEVFTTAHDAVFSQAELKPGERLLVHGGAGGVGTAAIQLGHASGARVTATVRNPDLRDGVAAFGATVIEPEGFADHGPFDVILELVGAPNLPDNLRALNLWGRIVVIGIGAGAKGELHLGRADGQAGTDPRLDAAPAPARGEGARRPRARALGAAADRVAARSACRSRRRTRSIRSRRRTSGSPRAASSGRSCS